MVQPDFSITQSVQTTPPWPASTPVPGPPSGPAGGMLAGMYPNPTIVPGVVVPGGTAGGDLSGTYPNPLVDGINGAPVGVTTPLARGDLLVAQDSPPTLTRLPLGATSLQLQSNGTDAIWATPLAGPPSGPAGGALGGTYPNPTIAYSAITGTPTSLPPSGPVPAGGDLQGSYPSPSLTAVAKSKWTETTGVLTPVTATDLVAIPGSGTTGETLRTGARTIKGRITSGLGGSSTPLYVTNNAAPSATANVWNQDDTLHSGWAMLFDPVGDSLRFQRSTPGQTGLTDLMTLDNLGDLTVVGTINASNTAAVTANTGTAVVSASAYGAQPAYASFKGYQARGSQGSPTATQNNDVIAEFAGLGYGTAATQTGMMRIQASETWTGTAHGTVIWFYVTPPGTTATGVGAVMSGNGDFQIYGSNATKASGTAWINPSDIRLKKFVVPYTRGLAAILALEPKEFEYNGRGGSQDGLTSIGLVANDVLEVMPEMVGTRRGKLEPDDDGDTDILTLDTSALPLALVNAVQELAARVRALEGGMHAS